MKTVTIMMYLVVNKKGKPELHTLHSSKTQSIKLFSINNSLKWSDMRKMFGYKCLKVDVQIMSSSNLW